ncbi:MAG TPA: nitroreductase family protein [Haloplasmataceae bacterium]
MLSKAIIKRCSVRKYTNQPVSKDIFTVLNEEINNIKPLFPELKYQIDIVKDGLSFQKILGGIIGSYGKIYAPHYLVGSCTNETNSYENIGFMLEYLVLRLTELNIGTCWIGGGIKRELLNEYLQLDNDLIPIIVIAFGYPQEMEVFRSNLKDFKRKPIEKIVCGNYQGYSDVMNLVRLAPSAINSQPWLYDFENNNQVNVFRIKPSFIMKPFINELNRIDIGISLCHFAIGLNEKNLAFSVIEQPKELRNFHYYKTLLIK